MLLHHPDDSSQPSLSNLAIENPLGFSYPDPCMATATPLFHHLKTNTRDEGTSRVTGYFSIPHSTPHPRQGSSPSQRHSRNTASIITDRQPTCPHHPHQLISAGHSYSPCEFLLLPAPLQWMKREHSSRPDEGSSSSVFAKKK